LRPVYKQKWPHRFLVQLEAAWKTIQFPTERSVISQSRHHDQAPSKMLHMIKETPDFTERLEKEAAHHCRPYRSPNVKC
jgi:hypothetical protein